MTYFANHVLSEIREVVRFGYIFMREQILIRILGIITIAQEKLEKMKQTQKIEFVDGALVRNRI